MNIKNGKPVINDTELEVVAGGTTPELPTPNPDSKEIHIYKNGLADPEQFTTKMGEEKESTSFKVGFFPGLSGFP